MYIVIVLYDCMDIVMVWYGMIYVRVGLHGLAWLYVGRIA